MRRGIALLSVLGFATFGAAGQTSTEMSAVQLTALVFDPSADGGVGAWVQSMAAQPGQQVEWRLDVVYSGMRSDLSALSGLLYQPTISGVDNIADDNGVDTLGPWGDMPGDPDVPCDFPTCNGGGGAQELARLGTPLPTYGRVNFTFAPMTATGQNVMTLFRHSGGSDGAPPGDWMRVAGSYVTTWPHAIPGTTTAAVLNLVMRGVNSSQSPGIAPDNRFVRGTAPTVFRQAITLSGSPGSRVLEISSFVESFRRVGGTTSTDDTRYVSWFTGPSDSGSHRTTPVFVPAFIFVTGTACDPIDFNRDTLFPDVQDIADFVTVFSGGVCPTASCGDVDFNNDGLFPDTADIESLLSVFAGGPCA